MKTIIFVAFLASTTLAVAQTPKTPANEQGTEQPSGSKGTTVKPAPAPVEKATSTWSLGAHGGTNISMHSASFSGLPGVPSCCPEYTSGSGGGFYAGLEADFPITPAVAFALRLGYASNGGTFEATEPTTVRINNAAVNTSFKHTLTTTTNYIMLEPAAEWRVAGGLGLVGGLRLGMLSSASYEQKETFTDPSLPYEYLNTNSATNNASSGTISQTNSMQFGLLIGARYHLPLNADHTFEIVPEAYYAPLFTQNVQNTSWSTSSIKLGLGLLYTFKIYAEESNPLAPR